MHANELYEPDAHSKLTDQFNDSLPYNIYSTQGTAGEGRGGVAVLVHNSMSHRIIDKPSLPTHKLWMTITIATPDEHIKLVATYMRPSPQSSPRARAEWTELADYAVHLGIKNNTVLIVGDLNASMNTPNTRRFPSQSKKLQERLLSSLLNAGRLVDAFPSLHPDSHYCTWWSTETWTSPASSPSAQVRIN
jgi:exonuclease III